MGITRWRILAICVAFLIIATGITIQGNSIIGEDKETEKNNGNAISLMAPSFIVSAESTASEAFPENEAGISAYFHPATNINLTLAKSSFATIDEETTNYIKGTVAVSKMTEDEYPYVWVSSEGWIVSYIPRDYKSEALIAPFGYGYSTTNLAEAIKKVSDAISISFDYNQVGYYHFKFPDANGMVMALEDGSYPADEFYVNLSKDITVSNLSWSYYSNDEYAKASLDGKSFVTGRKEPRKANGFFSESELEKGIDHKFLIDRHYKIAEIKLGIVIVYKS